MSTVPAAADDERADRRTHVRTVLHVTGGMAPDTVGGTERILDAWADRCAARGVTTVLARDVPTPGLPEREVSRDGDPDGASVVRVRGTEPARGTARRAAAERLVADLLAEFEPDVVHAHHPLQAAGAMDALRSHRKRTGTAPPLVVSWHGDAAAERALEAGDPRAGVVRRGLSPLAARALGSIQRRAVRAATAVVVHAPPAAEEARAAGAPRGRLHLVPLGVDREHFRPGAPAAERSPVVGLLGRPDRVRGGDRLVDAWPRVRTRVAGAHLEIAGDDTTAGATASRPRDVTARGVLADPAPWLAGLRVLAVPARRETFGLAALEAMACGTPVVASATGNLPDLLGDAAVLLPARADAGDWASALERVLTDDDLAADLGTAGSERAALWDWDRGVNDLLDLYADVCGSADGRHS